MTQAEKDCIWCEWMVEYLEAAYGWLHYAGQITTAEYLVLAARPLPYSIASFWDDSNGLAPGLRYLQERAEARLTA